MLEEAQSLVKWGHKEIVLTGIFLGAYGQQSVRRSKWKKGRNGQLADLLDKMAAMLDEKLGGMVGMLGS